jgi:hypothetical protein
MDSVDGGGREWAEGLEESFKIQVSRREFLAMDDTGTITDKHGQIRSGNNTVRVGFRGRAAARPYLTTGLRLFVEVGLLQTCQP